MIKPKYGVKCLHLGFDRYKKYCKLPVTVKPSSTTISFYVEKPSSPKGKNARVSNHHPNIQHYTDDGRQPWLTDNVSIEFIVPRSKEDKKRYRARVEQNASGTIQPFDVTTYQYDSTLIDPTDITTIFKAIIVFLNGGGYTDPFIGTPKQAKVLPRHSNIKPHRGSASSTPLTCSRNIGIDDTYLNEMTIYCLGDIIPLNENKQYRTNTNMNKKLIRLIEDDLHKIVKESVNRVLKEGVPMPPTAKDRGFEEFLRNKQNGESSSASVDRAYENMCGHAEEMQQKIDDIIEFIQQDLIGLYGSSRNKRIENYMFKKLDFLSALRKDFQTDSPIMQSYLNHMINPIR